jgi:hypothetical protein
MEQQYYLPQVVCLSAKNTGEIIQSADLFIGQVPKNGIWKRYINEDSPWANPFPCFSEKQRGSCLVDYEAWLRNEIKSAPTIWFPRMYEIVSQGRSITLGRFCGKKENPLPNHGDIIVKILWEFVQLLNAGQIPREYLTTNSTVPQNFQPTYNPLLEQKNQQQINLTTEKETKKQEKIEKQQIEKMQNPVNLPYVVVGVNGLQPTDKSKIVVIQVRDADVGNFDISLFITAGQVPNKVVQTFFGPEAGDQFAQQKTTIQQHNQNVFMQKPNISSKLSNGIDPEGICAEFLKGFDLKDAVKVPFPNCKPPNNQPVAQVVPQQPLPGLTNGNLPRPNQPVQANQPMYSIGDITSGQTSGRASGPTSGQVGVPIAVPPNAIPVEVVDFSTGTLLPNPSYQIPGGPRPIAYGEKWYWYLLQDGSVVKSVNNLIPVYQKQPRDNPTGVNQIPKADRAKQISLKKYGPVTGQINSGKGSSGRRAGATNAQPTNFINSGAVNGLNSGFVNPLNPGAAQPQQYQPNNQQALPQQPLPPMPYQPAPTAYQPAPNAYQPAPMPSSQPKKGKKAVSESENESDNEFSSEEQVSSEEDEGVDDDDNEIIGSAAQGASRLPNLPTLPSQVPQFPSNLLPPGAMVGGQVQPPGLNRTAAPQQPLYNPLTGLANAPIGLPNNNLNNNNNGNNNFVGGFPTMPTIDLSKPYVPPNQPKQ